ncbi:exo-rhamnogalacturonan lyase family protein [Streptomyces zhihengii]
MALPTRRALTLQPGAAPAAVLSAAPAACVTAPDGFPGGHAPVPLHWLGHDTPAELAAGATWDVPWPRGVIAADQEFSLTTESGGSVPVQSWPTAHWPDGSLKRTAHAVSGTVPSASSYSLAPGVPAQPRTPLTVHRGRDVITVRTGVVDVAFGRRGDRAILSVLRGGTVIAKDCRLVASRQDKAGTEGAPVIRAESFTGFLGDVTVEQEGPVRALITVRGTHRKGRRSWLPFVVRFSLYAGSDAIRMVHSYVFDGDEKRDFLNGLGVRFTVPMRGELQDRQVRFAGADRDVLVEAVCAATRVRRCRDGVRAGSAVPATTPTETWDARAAISSPDGASFGDFRLSQLNGYGYEMHKRGGRQNSWLRVRAGRRAAGLGYIGSEAGGLAFGMRNFWQLQPTELEISGAAGDEARATVWMWSPRAGAMDLRSRYDDPNGEIRTALAKGAVAFGDSTIRFFSSSGAARTTELTFRALEATPTTERFADLAEVNTAPPLLEALPQQMAVAKVF